MIETKTVNLCVPIQVNFTKEMIEDIAIKIFEKSEKDLVFVIRCKDCKWSRTNKNDDADVYYCELRTGRAYHGSDFCSYGAKASDYEKEK